MMSKVGFWRLPDMRSVLGVSPLEVVKRHWLQSGKPTFSGSLTMSASKP